MPTPRILRPFLAARKLETGGSGLVFRTRHGNTFEPSNVRRDARRWWAKAGLTSINPHECRHTYASLMIAAGVNAKALSTYMGHASIKITLDRYGKLMPGNEAEAADLLDAYLGQARGGWQRWPFIVAVGAQAAAVCGLAPGGRCSPRLGRRDRTRTDARTSRPARRTSTSA